MIPYPISAIRMSNFAVKQPSFEKKFMMLKHPSIANAIQLRRLQFISISDRQFKTYLLQKIYSWNKLILIQAK